MRKQRGRTALRSKTGFGFIGGRLGAALAVAGALASSPALAIPVVDVVFTSRNGTPIAPSASISAAPGDEIRAELRLSADANGISSYGVSLAFDGDGKNELDVLATPTELLPAGFQFNFLPGVSTVEESTSGLGGRILTFEAGTLGVGPANSSFAIGTIDFRVTANVATDGVDILTGIFNTGIDNIFDNVGVIRSSVTQFNGASINAVPEPGTALLVLAGLLGLGGQARRRRA